MSDRSDFQEFLELAGRKVGSKKALAKALGIRPQSVSRFLSGEYAPSIENCFLLADLTGESIIDVLRLAGKTEIAAGLVKHFGERKRDNVTPRERELLALWDKLSHGARQSFLTLMEESATKSQPSDRRRSRSGDSSKNQAG